MTDLRSMGSATSLATSARGAQIINVTVTGVNLYSGMIMVVDSMGIEFEVDASNRPKGTGFPREGESWTLERKGTEWFTKIRVDNVPIKIVSGGRGGLDPVIGQMLDALAEQGKLADATTYTPGPDVPDVPPSPLPPEDPAYDPDDPDGLPEEPDPIAPGPEIPDDGPEPDPTPTPTPQPKPPVTTPGPAEDPDTYAGKWSGIYVGSLNVMVAMSNAKAEHDLRKMAKSRVQVFAVQEMNHPERNAMVNRLADLGFSHYRPSGGGYQPENTIFWKTAQFTLRGSGSSMLSAFQGGKRPARWVNWVLLFHKASRREFYFLGTHLNPHVEDYTGHITRGPGYPSKDPARAPFVPAYYTQVNALAGHLKTFGSKAPTILVGDMNLNYFADKRVRWSKFPYAKWTPVGAKCNYGEIAKRPPQGTHGSRYIDQCWTVRLQQHAVRFNGHWVLTGYNTDHNPLLVKMSIRAKR